MPTLAKKNLPASMAKSTLPGVLTLKLPEDGKSISVLPVALLGRDSDGDGVLIFGDSDGAYITKPKYSEETLAPSLLRVANGNTQDESIDVSEYKEAIFFLDVTTRTGSSPTMDVYIDSLDPVSGKWMALTNFTQVGDETKTEAITQASSLGSSISVSWVLGGTDPTYTFSVGAVLKT